MRSVSQYVFNDVKWTRLTIDPIDLFSSKYVVEEDLGTTESDLENFELYNSESSDPEFGDLEPSDTSEA